MASGSTAFWMVRFQQGRGAWSCIKRNAERGANGAPLGVTDLHSWEYWSDYWSAY